MKKSSIYIAVVALVLVSLFYWNMYRNGSFNTVEVQEVNAVERTLYGEWVEGSFKEAEDENRFMTVQKRMAEELGIAEISLFYAVNPRKDNQESFKVFVGTEHSDELKESGVDTLQLKFGNLISGKQICAPGFQKIHGELINYAEKNKIELGQDSVFETYSENRVYVEMVVKNH